MEMYESLFSPNCVLNEQIARQVFSILPEGGPVVVIMDGNGNFWPSDSEGFANLNITESFLREVCDKIDDGDEPIIMQINDCSLVAAQLATDQTNCGYVIITLPQYSPESAMVNMDLIEVLLNQMNLIAKLIEKNNLLYELQLRRYNLQGQSEAVLN